MEGKPTFIELPVLQRADARPQRSASLRLVQPPLNASRSVPELLSVPTIIPVPNRYQEIESPPSSTSSSPSLHVTFASAHSDVDGDVPGGSREFMDSNSFAPRSSETRYRASSVLDGVRLGAQRSWNRRDTVTRRKGNNTYYIRLICLLLLLGLVAGPWLYLIDFVQVNLTTLRVEISEEISNRYLGWFVWVLLSLALIEAAILITSLLSPSAAGSGIPQLKSYLSGIEIPLHFKFKTLIAKSVGLACALSSGLPVGREGPYAHISTIVSHHLMKLPWFSHIGRHKSLRLQIIGSATALGVSSNFRTPVGGVLYSIEVTATYYLLSNYWKGFLSSWAGAAITFILVYVFQPNATARIIASDIYPFGTSRPADPVSAKALPLYLVMGAVLGVIGAAIVHLVALVGRWRKKARSKFSGRRLLYFNLFDGLIVGASIALVTIAPGEFMGDTYTTLLPSLFDPGQLNSSWDTGLGKYWNLAIYFLQHAVFMPLSITLFLPAGSWIPMFAGGAAAGRLVGEISQALWPNKTVFAGGFALVGAASLATGVTRTISTAAIVLEMTGQYLFAMPILGGVLAAFGAGNMLSKSIYDALMELLELPYLPNTTFREGLSARDVMNRELMFETKQTTPAKLLLLLNKMTLGNLPSVPVTADAEGMLVLGTLKKQVLEDMLEEFYTVHDLTGFEADVGRQSERTSHGRVSVSLTSFFERHNIRAPKLPPMQHRSLDSALDRGSIYQPGFNRMDTNDRSDAAMMNMLSTEWDAAKCRVLGREIELPEDALTPLSLTISESTPLEDIYVFFTMTRCDHLFVTTNGALSGVVTLAGLVDAGKEQWVETSRRNTEAEL